MASPAAFRPGAPTAPRGKRVTKNFSAKIPRNPLISLVSDERIQGNPSFSNPQKWGFCSERAEAQENPNRVRRTLCGRPREGATRSFQRQGGLIVRPSGLCGSHMLDCDRRPLGRQARGPGIGMRALGARVKLRPARRRDDARGGRRSESGEDKRAAAIGAEIEGAGRRQRNRAARNAKRRQRRIGFRGFGRGRGVLGRLGHGRGSDRRQAHRFRLRLGRRGGTPRNLDRRRRLGAAGGDADLPPPPEKNEKIDCV